MNREDVLRRIQDIFRDVFNDLAVQISEATIASDIEEWDSLEQINIILAVEKTFKIRFDIDQIEELKSIGKMIDIIMAKLAM